MPGLGLELLGALVDVVAVDARGEARLLQLLLDRLGLHARRCPPGRTYAQAEMNPASSSHANSALSSRVSRGTPMKSACAEHRVDHLLRIAALAQLLDAEPRMPGVEVRVALVVEVVHEPGDRPQSPRLRRAGARTRAPRPRRRACACAASPTPSTRTPAARRPHVRASPRESKPNLAELEGCRAGPAGRRNVAIDTGVRK